jgi:N-acetylmuramic acid 6-phosphate etherase
MCTLNVQALAKNQRNGDSWQRLPLFGGLFYESATHGYNLLMPAQPRESRRTEQRNVASRNLDRMTSPEIVRLMNREDRKVALAVRRELPAIARAVDAIVTGIRRGGRLIYVGAGTSGRIGVLDAAECPPTFGVSSGLVHPLIAGGARAITRAVEGAEDSLSNAVRDLREKKLAVNDVVVGITASGTTPYVVKAIEYARSRGATTVAITVNAHKPVARAAKIVIAPNVGPEVLTGSTRLKAGTSQKMVLNMLSTAAMVRLGHAYENFMIDALPTNHKVAVRALRILQATTGKSLSASAHALRQAGHNLRVALLMLKLNLSASAAKKKLSAAGGDLRAALGE